MNLSDAIVQKFSKFCFVLPPRWKIMFTAIVVTLANKNTALHSLDVTKAILIHSFALCPDLWGREQRIKKKIQSYAIFVGKLFLFFLLSDFCFARMLRQAVINVWISATKYIVSIGNFEQYMN